jgi:6-phosphofructokinase
LVGATHTATDALILTNFLLEKGSPTRIIVVPATIDGNVGHHMLEAVVGFDTAAKVYS